MFFFLFSIFNKLIILPGSYIFVDAIVFSFLPLFRILLLRQIVKQTENQKATYRGNEQ